MLTGSLPTTAYLALGTAAALCFYLASPHQRLRPALHRHARPLRVAGWLLCLAGLGAAMQALGPWAGVFAGLTVFMLAAVLLPYLDVWCRQPAGKNNHVG